MHRVLLIEDEAVLARNIRIYLERTGLLVDVATSGEQGIEVAGRSVPQVVVLDHNLPGISGLDALARISRIAPDAGIIVITGNSDRALEAGFRSRGVNEFLSKPVALCTLRQRIEKLLECHDRQIVESV